jgi:hypothetical protein
MLVTILGIQESGSGELIMTNFARKLEFLVCLGGVPLAADFA